MSATMAHTATEAQAEDGGSASKPQRVIKLGKTPDDSDNKVLSFSFFNCFWWLLSAYPKQSFNFSGFFLVRLFLFHSSREVVAAFEIILFLGVLSP